MPNYRIYANRQDALPWSVDSGTQADEQHVRDICGYKVSFRTITDFTVQTGDEQKPKWIIVAEFAILKVIDGVAMFFHDPDWREPKIKDSK
jgi:hypothetical protein